MAAGLALSLTSCAPSVIVHTTQVRSPAPATGGFVVIKDTEPFTGTADELGDIEIKDTGLTLSCNYETVVALATKEAQQLGANVLRIYEHRLPDLWGSSCHHIRAKALLVSDLSPYEREIVWSPARRLRPADFKGNTASRPFEAATSSGIRYHYAGRVYQGKVQLSVEAVFDCQNSYFKGTQDAARTLAHEQGHFDITELCARRFAKAIQEQVANTKELAMKEEEIYRRINTEATTLQDRYDSEIYADRSQQPVWLTRIAQDLAALQPYADKQLTIKIKL